MVGKRRMPSKIKEAPPRRQQILEIAARLFARNGYQGTSIRDIGEEAGVLGGSLYHHIKSKDALFVELHDSALDAAAQAVDEAVAKGSDPWDRLERACVALLAIQLDPDSLTLPLMNDFRHVPDDVRRQLIRRRDQFEEPFKALVDELPLPADFDRSVYRNALLSLINSAGDWYRPGRMPPTEIARQFALIFKHR